MDYVRKGMLIEINIIKMELKWKRKKSKNTDKRTERQRERDIETLRQ
jgi:hypothetical protein